MKFSYEWCNGFEKLRKKVEELLEISPESWIRPGVVVCGKEIPFVPEVENQWPFNPFGHKTRYWVEQNLIILQLDQLSKYGEKEKISLEKLFRNAYCEEYAHFLLERKKAELSKGGMIDLTDLEEVKKPYPDLEEVVARAAAFLIAPYADTSIFERKMREAESETDRETYRKVKEVLQAPDPENLLKSLKEEYFKK